MTVYCLILQVVFFNLLLSFLLVLFTLVLVQVHSGRGFVLMCQIFGGDRFFVSQGVILLCQVTIAIHAYLKGFWKVNSQHVKLRLCNGE